ncbi:hypothetical protein ACOME3_003302 [Neoechinorhynchus agilis]
MASVEKQRPGRATNRSRKEGNVINHPQPRENMKTFEDIITEEEFDALLAQLTPEELQAINDEVDPDDTYLPASERVKNQTNKEPTGPFDRLHLINFLEEKAKEEKDWEEVKPFVKETRGTVWKPKEPEPSVATSEKVFEDADSMMQEEFDLTTAEWDEVLKRANEGEIAELAAILGLTGLVNQRQYYAAQKGESANLNEGWSAATKAEELQYFPPEPDNDTNIEEIVERLRQLDKELSSVNLNNIKDLPSDKLDDLLELMKTNRTVLSLHLCNLGLADSVGKKLCDILKVNETLITLNAESNRFTSSMMIDLVRATLEKQTLKDLRMSNQRAQILGNRCEMEISELVDQNKTILRLGIHFCCIGPRAKVSEALKRNMDALREARNQRLISEKE